MTRTTRYLIAPLVLALALVNPVPTGAETAAGGSGPAQACVPDRTMTLYAARKGPQKVGYGLTPSSITIPGPTMEMTEGECLAVTLVNQSDRRLSLHAHGVSYSPASDGTPMNKSCVAPGKSRTYVFAAPPIGERADGSISPGSAGYWHYHDHCMGSPHGTIGLDSGLFGALIVRREGDPRPDGEPHVLVMKDLTFNLRSAPRTPVIEARMGERVEFVVITHGDFMHTFHLHAHRWADNRTGLLADPDDTTQSIDNKAVGPGDSFGFQVIAGEVSGPGAWMYHCHMQGHSDGGMEGIFLVTEADGSITPGARAALHRWRGHSHGR
jgi:manganese oxidase